MWMNENIANFALQAQALSTEFKLDQGIFSLVIILLILITVSLDNVRILSGENWCWSLLGLKGLSHLVILHTKKSSKAARISPASSPTRSTPYHRSMGEGGSCPFILTSGVTTQRPMNSSWPFKNIKRSLGQIRQHRLGFRIPMKQVHVE